MSIIQQPIGNFQQEPFDGEQPDETSHNLRAYIEDRSGKRFASAG